MFVSQVSLDEIFKFGLHVAESCVDVLSGFGASHNNFARGKDQQTHFGDFHLVDQTWKSIWVKSAKRFMRTVHKSFKINFVVNTTRSNHVLNSELRNFNFLLAHFLNCSSIMLGCILTLLFTLCSCDNHLTRLEYQCCCPLWILHPHDDCSKTSWIILGISTFEGNLL